MARSFKPKPTTLQDEELILRLYGSAYSLSIRDIRIVTDFRDDEIQRVLNVYHFPRRQNRRSHIAWLQVEISRERRQQVG